MPRFSTPERFGRADLYRIDVIAVPERLEDAVGETQNQDILYSLLAQIMVDPVDVLFREYFAQFLAEPFGRFEIGPERFFDDDPAPSLAGTGFVQALFLQADGNALIHHRRSGQVVDDPVVEPVLLLQLFDPLLELAVLRFVRGVETQVMDQLQEASDLFRIVRLCFRAVEDRFALFFAELFVRESRPRGSQYPELLREQVADIEFEKRGEQLAFGQVPRSPEYDQ